MHKLSLRQLSTALQEGSFSSKELTSHYLQRIQENSSLNAFITINEEQALLAAQHADDLLKQKRGKLLTGIPMAHKDIFCTTTLPTTCGSKMLANFYSPYTATIVNKIADQGAVMLGKTNMDEFAMGSSNQTSYFGSVKNPWKLSHVPGGSSGGSAAAVAADLAAFTTASDTGGSIRQPAAFCGVSGIKPTYGLASRYGMVAFASSLDQAGPIARSAEDLAIVLEALLGFDPQDATSINKAVPNYSANLNKPLAGLRIGLPRSFFQKGLATDIEQALVKASAIFKQEKVELIELDLQLQDLWVPCYYVIACAEASSNLSRYDGLRFGYQSKQAANLRELITRSRSEGFGLEVKRRILTGTHVLSSGFFDDYYLQALKIRRLIQQELLTALATVDLILSPTTPTTAFGLGEKITDPSTLYLADIFTVGANLAGLPAISIPVGFSEGLPIGMQLIGNYFSEETLLNTAHQYQQYTNCHQARPTFKG